MGKDATWQHKIMSDLVMTPDLVRSGYYADPTLTFRYFEGDLKPTWTVVDPKRLHGFRSKQAPFETKVFYFHGELSGGGGKYVK